MRYIKDIIILVLLLLVIYLIFKKDNKSDNNNNTSFIDTVIVIRDTITNIITNNNLKPIYIDTGKNITYLPLDTNYIKMLINDYLTSKYYVDTIQNDTSMLVIVKDTINKNSIVYRQSITKNNRPLKTIVNTTTVVNKNTYPFVSTSFLRYNKNSNYIGLGLGYTYKNNSIGFTYFNNNSFLINFSTSINLNKK